jgi:LuxR family transcriptional regulator, maltose regulon positive regulatory protein
MPHGNNPWVRNGQVITDSGQRLRLDSPAWFAWLETIPSFCFSSRNPLWRLTVRREKRRRQTYWYGYAKSDAKLHNVYLGKTAQLTQARLEQACQELAHKVRQEKERAMATT